MQDYFLRYKLYTLIPQPTLVVLPAIDAVMYTCVPVWAYQSPSPLYLYRIIPHSYYQFSLSLYETTFSTQLFSSFLTSALKFSTSCQQSSGRRSCSRRHRMTSLRAPSTLSGRGRTCLRDSSFARMASISLLTVYWLVLLSSLKSALASFSCAILRASASFCCSFLSSSATRAWIWSSTILEREASVYLESRERALASIDVRGKYSGKMMWIEVPHCWIVVNQRDLVTVR